MSLAPEYVLLVWAARKFRRALAWIEDRRENLTASFHSRDQRHQVRGAFDAEGRLLALEADIACNVGAYSCYPVTCGVEPLMAMAEFPGPYDIREYKVRSRGIATNTCPMAPYRGVSRPGDHLFAGAADGLRRRASRHRPRRYPPAQSRRGLPLQDRHRPHL